MPTRQVVIKFGVVVCKSPQGLLYCPYTQGEDLHHMPLPGNFSIQEVSMRSIKWLGLFLTAVFILLCGSGGSTEMNDVPTDIQFLPNMGQQITPLAPQGSRFVPMKPD